MNITKAPCLALVVKAEVPENIGKICTVISRFSSTHWNVEFPENVIWSNGKKSKSGPATDDQLIQLNDPDTEIDTDIETNKNVEVPA